MLSTVAIKSRSFYEAARELQVGAKEDVDKLISEVRGRDRRLYE